MIKKSLLLACSRTASTRHPRPEYYARELTRWDIETSIIAPGAFTVGTNHCAYAGSPADPARAADHEAGPYKGFADEVLKGFSSIVPPDGDVSVVAEAIVRVVDAPFGKRPFRVHVDPTQDGAEVVNMVSDWVRAEMLRRIGLGDLLTPRVLTTKSQNAAERLLEHELREDPQRWLLFRFRHGAQRSKVSKTRDTGRWNFVTASLFF